MGTEYYPYGYRIGESQRYLIWYSNDNDGVLLNEAGQIVSTSSVPLLLEYAAKQGISLDSEDAPILDLDTVAKWLRRPKRGRIDCNLFLDAWNLFDDVQSSMGSKRFLRKKVYRTVNDKLFWGSNLPALTPEGKHYTPKWRRKEIGKIKQALSKGLAIFRKRVAPE